MSCSNIYKVYKTKTRELAEFHNSWGTAPVLWGYLCEKYLNQNSNFWLTAGFGKEDTLKPLWNLAENPTVPTCLRLTHAFTFKNAVCPPNKKDELAKACQEVFNLTYDSIHVNHWKAVAESLKSCKINKHMVGIALSCTSVEDPWISGNGSEAWDLFSVLQ